MYFTLERIKRIADELSEYTRSERVDISSFKMKEGSFKGGEKTDLDTSQWNSFYYGNRWGGRDKHYWFRTSIVMPKEFEGKTVVFEVRTGREGDWDALNPQFIVYVNGKLIQGLDVNHREIILCEQAKPNSKYEIALNAYSGMKDGFCVLEASISVLEKEIERLYYNIKVPLDVAELLDQNDKRRIDILKYLNDAINMLDLRKPFSHSFNKSIEDANRFLEDEFYGNFCGREDITAICVGHTHIDVAWLWTLSQTREKAARSFSTVLNLMKQYPEYIFMSSQPQLYKFVKEDYPEVYEEIKHRVKEGKWEAEGAMWLEADCNLTSGESLVRQILFGTSFFEKEFGVKNRILWLPDVFGYSAALPQILKKSGIEYFMTTKISWNEYNKMPYDTFMWRGIDGTEILTYFITTKELKVQFQTPHTTTYNGEIKPSQVMGAWDRYQNKDLSDEVLISFGYGDGGGGPTKEMLEYARRMEKGIPGCPKVKIGKSSDFFNRLNDKANKKMLPKWVGELYLEYHRGTYTSMARNKKYNRKAEFLWQDAELFNALGCLTGNQKNYPKDEINKGWETILLNQFHDILPGSSIKEVYEDSKIQYQELFMEGNNLVKKAIDSICNNVALKDDSIIVFNQLGFMRSDIVELELPASFENIEIYDITGEIINYQVNHNKKLLFYAENVPAKGYKVFRTRKSDKKHVLNSSDISKAPYNLSNKYFDIKFDKDYNIVSLFDKINMREVIKKGSKANVLQAFEDKPHNFDAWDINIYYQEKMWEINSVEEVKVIEEGPVRTGISIKRSFLDSKITQNIYIYNDLPRIDFVSTIDWMEKQILLKAAFPVDIHADKATYDIQYGNVERPTHWNTSWDYARFEVCAHKWADISEDGYGVSLLNDCKYGYDIKDSVIRLTLLKSAVDPNVDADRELHEFTYSLYPHAEDWRKAGTVDMAYSLNCPMYAKFEQKHQGSMPEEFSLVKCDKENVIIEILKKAEDRDCFILRMYECYNRRTKATLSFFKELSEVYECSLVEEIIDKVPFEGKSFEFEIKPYEIKTFMFKLV